VSVTVRVANRDSSLTLKLVSYSISQGSFTFLMFSSNALQEGQWDCAVADKSAECKFFWLMPVLQKLNIFCHLFFPQENFQISKTGFSAHANCFVHFNQYMYLCRKYLGFFFRRYQILTYMDKAARLLHNNNNNKNKEKNFTTQFLHVTVYD
jgi:hypothetical protein